jgi:hypothetical protein
MTRGWALFLTLPLLLVGNFPASYAAEVVAPDGAPIVKFDLHADESLPARTVSFGQIFLPGTVRSGDQLQVMLDGHAAGTQVDAKAFNADGSVRHAVVTVELPKLRSGQKLNATIVKQAGAAAAAPTGDIAVPPLDVVVGLKGGNGAVKPIDINLQTVAQNPKNAAPGFWLNGPLAQERRYTADVNDHLQIQFDVFAPKTGPARIDVIFHNDWTGIHHSDDFDYDVDMSLAGAPVYQARGVHQYTFSTWHRVLWTDGKSSVRVVPDLATLEAAGAVPRYDANFPIARDITGDIGDAANKLSDKPMSSGTVDHHMPDAGGRWDIGPLPTWDVVDLLDGNETTRKLVMANGDAAGMAPWHLRERKTGLPLTIDAHPKTWLDQRGQGTVQEGVLPEVFHEESNGWTLDDAHEPALSYLPYLLTGSQYYRDELAAQAAYVLLSYDQDYRGGSHGYIIGEKAEAWEQVRGMAWSLRTIANAAYVLPSSYPLRGYFDAKLKGNLAHLVQLFVQDRKMKAAGPMEGWVTGDYGAPGANAPWQQGFLAVVLTWINDMGYPDAGRLTAWMSNFFTGLFTSGDQGFDPMRGTAYILAVFDPDSGKLLNNWGESYAKSKLAEKPAKEVDELWQDYGRVLQAALAGAYSITHDPRTQKAYEFVRNRTNQIAWPHAKGDPTFAILPRPAEAAPAP